MRHINITLLFIAGLLLCACASAKEPESDPRQHQPQADPVLPLRADLSAVLSETGRFCARPGNLAFMTRQGCESAAQKLARDFENSGMYFENETTCENYLNDLLQRKEEVLLEHDAWCSQNFANLHDRKGCKDAGETFYSRLNAGEFCGKPAPPEQPTTPKQPTPRAEKKETPYILNYSEPGQKFDSPKTGPTPKTRPGAVKTPPVKASAPAAATGKSSTPARATPPASTGVAKAPVAPAAVVKTPAAPATVGKAAVAPATKATAITAPAAQNAAPAEKTATTATPAPAAPATSSAPTAQGSPISAGNTAVAPAQPGSDAAYSWPQAPALGQAQTAPAAQPVAPATAQPLSPAAIPATAPGAVEAASPGNNTLPGATPVIAPPPVQPATPVQPGGVSNLGMSPVGGVPAGVLATGGGVVPASVSPSPAPAPTPPAPVSNLGTAFNITEPAIGRVQQAENLPPVPPIGQVVPPLMPGVPPDTAVSSATLPAPASSPVAGPQPAQRAAEPADAFGDIIPNFMPPPPPPPVSGNTLPVGGMPAGQAGN